MSTSELIVLLGLVLAAFAWTMCALIAWIGLRSMPNPHPRAATDASADIPEVAILLAARDEEARIEETVKRALAQTRIHGRVVAINDRSTDRTGEILERLARDDDRLMVIRVDALPDGWLGKSHALHVGAAHTNAEWLLFIDADTWLAPDAARAGIDVALRTNAGHVCFAPSMSSTTLPGRATLLSGMVLLACNAWSVHSRFLPGYMGVGAFNLVRTDAYRSFGGHGALRLEVLDDVKLGLLANRAGAHTKVALAPDLVEVEWAGSARGFIRLLQKNAFATQGYSTARTVALAAAGAFLLLAPWIGLVVVIATEQPSMRLAGLLTIAAYLATLLPAAQIVHRFGWGMTAILLAPLGFWVSLAAGVNSAAQTLAAGGVRWRETFYPLKDLRRSVDR